MVDTVFIDTTATTPGTPIVAAWLNDINGHTYKDAPISPASSTHSSATISFQQSGVGATTRTSQDKHREFINIQDFGFPVTATTMQNALNACVGGKTLLIKGSITLASQVIVPVGCAGIVGDGMGSTTVIFTREQIDGTGEQANCAIVGIGLNGAIFENFTIQYTGTFFSPGLSYWGLVSGLFLKDCTNTLVRQVEATGFNYSGIRFLSTVSSYSLRNSVVGCYLHHNRVGGCNYSWQKFFTIRDSKLEYNGLDADGGTGYGCSALDGDPSEDVLITGNFTNHNYRKGIDFHSGFNVVCTDNVCIGDRLHGIFYENTSTTVGNVVISDNFIQVDPNFYNPPSGGVYDFYKPIACYLDYNAGSTNPNVDISGNVISDLYKNNAAVAVWGIYLNNQTGLRTQVNITNNKVRGGNCLFAIGVEGPIRDSELIANIEGNQISVGSIAAYAIYSTPFSATSGGWLSVINNTIVAAACGQAVITVKTGHKGTRIINNSAFITTLTDKMVSVDTTTNQVVTIENNDVNTTTGNSLTKYFYGDSLNTRCSHNLYGGAEQGSISRVAVDTGASKKWQGSKALTASILTDVIRIGQQFTHGFYKVKWSAWYNTALPGTATAGGEFTFVAGWSDNGQTTISTFNVLAAQAANNGIPDIVLTWGVAVDITDDFIRKLQVTSNISCTLSFEVEATMSMDKTTGTKYALL